MSQVAEKKKSAPLAKEPDTSETVLSSPKKVSSDANSLGGKKWKNSADDDDDKCEDGIRIVRPDKEEGDGDGGDCGSTELDAQSKKSSQARTRAIVINLDDKSRFSEEVTV